MTKKRKIYNNKKETLFFKDNGIEILLYCEKRNCETYQIECKNDFLVSTKAIKNGSYKLYRKKDKQLFCIIIHKIVYFYHKISFETQHGKTNDIS